MMLSLKELAALEVIKNPDQLEKVRHTSLVEDLNFEIGQKLNKVRRAIKPLRESYDAKFSQSYKKICDYDVEKVKELLDRMVVTICEMEENRDDYTMSEVQDPIWNTFIDTWELCCFFKIDILRNPQISILCALFEGIQARRSRFTMPDHPPPDILKDYIENIRWLEEHIKTFLNLFSHNPESSNEIIRTSHMECWEIQKELRRLIEVESKLMKIYSVFSRKLYYD